MYIKLKGKYRESETEGEMMTMSQVQQRLKEFVDLNMKRFFKARRKRFVELKLVVISELRERYMLSLRWKDILS